VHGTASFLNSVPHLSGFLVLERALRVANDLRADRIVLLIRRLDVHIVLAQSLDEYVALFVHLYFDALVYVPFGLLRLRISHGIVESAESYPVNQHSHNINRPAQSRNVISARVPLSAAR